MRNDTTLGRTKFPMSAPPGRKIRGVGPWRRPPLCAPLPQDALALVFRSLCGDVASLLSAECVSPAWRAAARRPELWERVSLGSVSPCSSSELANSIDDDALASLVARGAGATHTLDVTGAARLTENGLAAALEGAPGLRVLRLGGCVSLTVSGVEAALRGRRALVALSVDGVRYGPAPTLAAAEGFGEPEAAAQDDDPAAAAAAAAAVAAQDLGDAAEQEANALRALRSLASDVDVTSQCAACRRLIVNAADLCDCGRSFCDWCATGTEDECKARY